MQTRPFYKRLASLLRRDPKHPMVALPPEKPPAPPVQAELKAPATAQGRKKARSPGRKVKVFIQPPSRDPRFNHALRRQL